MFEKLILVAFPFFFFFSIFIFLYQLESFLNGNIDEMIDALAAADKADRLKEGNI